MNTIWCAVSTCPYTAHREVGGEWWCRKHAESARIDWEVQLSLDVEVAS